MASSPKRRRNTDKQALSIHSTCSFDQQQAVSNASNNKQAQQPHREPVELHLLHQVGGRNGVADAVALHVAVLQCVK